MAREPRATREYSARPRARRVVGKKLNSKAEVLAELHARFSGYSEFQMRLLCRVANFAATAWLFQSMRTFHEQTKKTLHAVEQLALPELRSAPWAVSLLDKLGWPDLLQEQEPPRQMELWPESARPVGRWFGLPNLGLSVALAKAVFVQALAAAAGASGKALEWGPPESKGRPTEFAANKFATGLVRIQPPRGKFGRKIAPTEAALLAAYFEIEGQGTPMHLDSRAAQWAQRLHKAKKRAATKREEGETEP